MFRLNTSRNIPEQLALYVHVNEGHSGMYGNTLFVDSPEANRYDVFDPPFPDRSRNGFNIARTVKGRIGTAWRGMVGGMVFPSPTIEYTKVDFFGTSCMRGIEIDRTAYYMQTPKHDDDIELTIAKATFMLLDGREAVVPEEVEDAEHNAADRWRQFQEELPGFIETAKARLREG